MQVAGDLPRRRVIRTDGHAIVLDLSAGSRLYGESLKGLDSSDPRSGLTQNINFVAVQQAPTCIFRVNCQKTN